MVLFSYNSDPFSLFDQRKDAIPGCRGSAIPGNERNAVIDVEGKLYALDHHGFHVWNGLVPRGISDDIQPHIDRINWQYAAKFHATFNVKDRLYKCYLCLDSETEPNTCFVYDVDKQVWIGMDKYDQAITMSARVLDSEGATQEFLGDENNRYWFAGIGTTDGVRAGTTASGLVAAGSSRTAVIITGGGLDTTGNGLAGVPAYWVEGDETKIVSSNTATTLTMTGTGFSSTPATGATIRLGRIRAYIMTRIYAPTATQTMQGDYLYLRWKPTTTAIYANLRVYLNFSTTAVQDWGSRSSLLGNQLNGVTTTLGSPDIAIDLSLADGIVQIPLSGWGTAVQFRLEFPAAVDLELYDTLFSAQVEEPYGG
jgi:hypothetical protein